MLIVKKNIIHIMPVKPSGKAPITGCVHYTQQIVSGKNEGTTVVFLK